MKHKVDLGVSWLLILLSPLMILAVTLDSDLPVGPTLAYIIFCSAAFYAGLKLRSHCKGLGRG